METPIEEPAEIAARFDERAAHYDESAMHRSLATAVAEFASLDGAHDVLDVATGTGLALRSLPRDTGLALTGIDISNGMLAVARAELPSAHFLQADAARLPFEDASFDLVTCVIALHLLPDAPAALSEWRRILRPGGRIVVATFAVDHAADAATTERRVGHGTTAIARHAPFGSRAALELFAAMAGLHVTRSETWVHPSDSAGDAAPDVCLITEFAAG